MAEDNQSFVWISEDQLPKDRRSTIKQLIEKYQSLDSHESFLLKDLTFMITNNSGTTRARHSPSGIEATGLSTKDAMNQLMRMLADWVSEGIHSYALLRLRSEIDNLSAKVALLEEHLTQTDDEMRHFIGG